MKVWTCVSNDKYELIEHMADSVKELAEICGVRPNTIYSAVSHCNKCGGRSIYHCVEIGDLNASEQSN